MPEGVLNGLEKPDVLSLSLSLRRTPIPEDAQKRDILPLLESKFGKGWNWRKSF